MRSTLPFWVGALILVMPAVVMIFAVIGILPSWIGIILFLFLFSLPIPAAVGIIGNGFRAWNQAQSLGDRRSDIHPLSQPSRSVRLHAAIAILLGLMLLGVTLMLLVSFVLNMRFG